MSTPAPASPRPPCRSRRRTTAGPPRSPPKDLKGWTELAPNKTVNGAKERWLFTTRGKRYRYYLLWITSLPPNQQNVQVAELTLYKNGS